MSDAKKANDSDLSLQTIQIEEPQQLEKCHHLLCTLPELCYFHLQQLTFPRTMHSQINKISASGQELGSGMLFSQRIGFSGTPSSLLPTELQPCHFEKESEGKIVATLCDPTLCAHTVFPKLGKSWNVEGLLQHVSRSLPRSPLVLRDICGWPEDCVSDPRSLLVYRLHRARSSLSSTRAHW